MSPKSWILCCEVTTRTFQSTVSFLVLSVHGDSSGAGGSSGYCHGGRSQPSAPPVVEVEAVAEGPWEGP